MARTLHLVAACVVLTASACASTPSFDRTDATTPTRRSSSLQPTARVRVVITPATAEFFERELEAAVLRNQNLAAIGSLADAEAVVRVTIDRRTDGSLSSFFVCFPGFVVFAPLWRGLDWPYEVESNIDFERPPGTRVATTRLVALWTARYTPPVTAALAESSWLFLPYPFPALEAGALSIVEPADTGVLDDAFSKQCAREWADEVVQAIVTTIARLRDREDAP